MKQVYLIDILIPVTYRGGSPASILPHEHTQLRPSQPGRRVDWTFRYNTIEAMDKDYGQFLITKYPNRFKMTSKDGVDEEAHDEFDEMNHDQLKAIIKDINDALKERNESTLSVIGKTDDLRERIRMYKKAEKKRILDESRAKQAELEKLNTQDKDD